MDNNSKPSFINERPVTAGRFLFQLICSLVEYHRSLNNFAFAYVLSHCCVVREKHKKKWGITCWAVGIHPVSGNHLLS